MNLLDRKRIEYDKPEDYIKETGHSYRMKLKKLYPKYDYAISKNRIQTEDELLWWVAHLSAKGTDSHAIYFLMKAVCNNTNIDFGRPM